MGISDWDDHWSGPIEQSLARGLLSQTQLARYVRQGLSVDFSVRNRYSLGDRLLIEDIRLVRKNLPAESLLVISATRVEVSIDGQTFELICPFESVLQPPERVLVFRPRPAAHAMAAEVGCHEIQLRLYVTVGVRTSRMTPSLVISFARCMDIEIVPRDTPVIQLRDDGVTLDDAARAIQIDMVAIEDADGRSKVSVKYSVSNVLIPIVGLVTIQCDERKIDVGHLCVHARWGEGVARGEVWTFVDRLTPRCSRLSVGICPDPDYAKAQTTFNEIVGACVTFESQVAHRLGHDARAP